MTMTTSRRRFCRRACAPLALGAAAALLMASPLGALAQAWPSKGPIKLISPYAPGGTTDVLARMMAPILQQKLGQTVVVDNRAGAGGNIGTDAVAKAAPDGYTFLVASSGPVVMAPSLYAKLPYQPMRDFTFVAPLMTTSFVILANPNAGIGSLKDLIGQAKTNSKLNFASAGTGTPQHIIGEMFNQRAGVKLAHIPYRGSGPALNDLLAGQVPIAIENPVPAMPFVKTGRLKVLAITGAKRSPAYPEIPTVAELGLSGFDAKPWYGLLGPAGLDPAITQRMNAAVREVLAMTEVKARLFALGAEPMAMSSGEFTAFTQKELDKWTQVVKASGATAD